MIFPLLVLTIGLLYEGLNIWILLRRHESTAPFISLLPILVGVWTWPTGTNWGKSLVTFTILFVMSWVHFVWQPPGRAERIQKGQAKRDEREEPAE